jgi:hypothetical protein
MRFPDEETCYDVHSFFHNAGVLAGCGLYADDEWVSAANSPAFDTNLFRQVNENYSERQ